MRDVGMGELNVRGTGGSNVDRVRYEWCEVGGARGREGRG